MKAAARLGRPLLRPERSWVASQGPYLIDSLLTTLGRLAVWHTKFGDLPAQHGRFRFEFEGAFVDRSIPFKACMQQLASRCPHPFEPEADRQRRAKR